MPKKQVHPKRGDQAWSYFEGKNYNSNWQRTWTKSKNEELSMMDVGDDENCVDFKSFSAIVLCDTLWTWLHGEAKLETELM